jgi:hypothetical protein
MGSDAQGEPTSYMKPERATEPDEVMLPRQVAKSRRSGAVAQDGTVDPKDNRWAGLRNIVARACDVDNRWGGKQMGEYYAEKYPPFVRMASREADIKQRAAVIAAKEGR